MPKDGADRSTYTKYRTEIVISALLALGVFLIRTEIPLQVIILNSIHYAGQVFNDARHFLTVGFVDPLKQMQVSDIFGLVLIMYSSGLFIGQVRKRMISSSFEPNECPACNHKLRRIHRSRWQRFLSKSLYLSSGYFQCETCGHTSLHFFNKSTHLKRS